MRGLIRAIASEAARGSPKRSVPGLRGEFTVEVRRNPSTGDVTLNLPDDQPPFVAGDNIDLTFKLKGSKVTIEWRSFD